MPLPAILAALGLAAGAEAAGAGAATAGAATAGAATAGAATAGAAGAEAAGAGAATAGAGMGARSAMASMARSYATSQVMRSGESGGHGISSAQFPSPEPANQAYDAQLDNDMARWT